MDPLLSTEILDDTVSRDNVYFYAFVGLNYQEYTVYPHVVDVKIYSLSRKINPNHLSTIIRYYKNRHILEVIADATIVIYKDSIVFAKVNNKSDSLIKFDGAKDHLNILTLP